MACPIDGRPPTKHVDLFSHSEAPKRPSYLRGRNGLLPCLASPRLVDGYMARPFLSSRLGANSNARQQQPAAAAAARTHLLNQAVSAGKKGQCKRRHLTASPNRHRPRLMRRQKLWGPTPAEALRAPAPPHQHHHTDLRVCPARTFMFLPVQDGQQGGDIAHMRLYGTVAASTLLNPNT